MQLTISGMFFQENVSPKLGCGSEGIGLYMHTQMLQTHFSGIIYDDPDSAMPKLIGLMQDQYGNSKLSGIGYDPENTDLIFVKKYEDRDDSIEYTFSKRDRRGVWIGKYEGELTGSGVAWCVTNDIEDYLLKPSSLALMLEN